MFKPLFASPFLGSVGHAIGAYFARLGRRSPHVRDLESLRAFIDSRASHVTQTALYGYLRTRAGSRYPELFANEAFLVAINAAKWNIWTASVSDLAIYAGALIVGGDPRNASATAHLMVLVVEDILERTGLPREADQAFPQQVAAMRRRVQSCHWHDVADNETVFTQSPEALVRWAPVMDELKQLDADIVRNSVRFRWNAVRQEFRQLLDRDAVLAAAHLPGEGPPTPS